jgi:hypothetical protein
MLIFFNFKVYDEIGNKTNNVSNFLNTKLNKTRNETQNQLNYFKKELNGTQKKL